MPLPATALPMGIETLKGASGLVSSFLSTKRKNQRLAEQARVAEENSKLAVEAGREQMRQQSKKFSKFQGSQNVQIAKSGVAESGSALDVVAESIKNFESDMLESEADYKNKEAEYKYQAEYARYSQNQNSKQFLMNATAQGMGTGLNMGMMGAGL